MVKPNLLYVADTFLPKKDGVVTFMMETAKRLKEDFNISFLVPKFENSEKAAKTLGFDVTFVPVRRFEVNDYRIAHPKSKLIKNIVKGADIVFVHSAAPLGANVVKNAKKLNKKIVLYIHSIDWELLAHATRLPVKYSRILRPLVRRTHGRTTVLLTPDKRISQIMKTKKTAGKIRVVQEGLDKNRFSFDRTKKVLFKKELGVEDKFVIGYLGRLSKEKNIELLVRAFEVAEKKIPNAVLLLVGGGPLEKKIPKKSSIILTGVVQNPEDYLHAMDVFVLLSKTETTALSLMEALSCNLPVIASSVGAIPSYVEHKQNGLLISKKSLNAEIVAKLIYQVYSNPTLRAKLRANAEKTVKKFYSWDETASELKDIFNELLE